MEIIKILFSKLYQEKKETEYLLEMELNTPSMNQLNNCKLIIKKICDINSSISLLSSYVPVGETEVEE